jgi:hypothetical protein
MGPGVSLALRSRAVFGGIQTPVDVVVGGQNHSLWEVQELDPEPVLVQGQSPTGRCLGDVPGQV